MGQAPGVRWTPRPALVVAASICSFGEADQGSAADLGVRPTISAALGESAGAIA